MKLLKKIFAWLVLCLCVVIPNILITLIGYILPTAYFFNMAILIIYLILIVAFAFVGFNLSQVISLSKGGLRYKVIAIFTIITGSLGGFSKFLDLRQVDTLIEIFTDFGNLFMFLICFLNAHFIYGITTLILYKNNYKKLKS